MLVDTVNLPAEVTESTPGASNVKLWLLFYIPQGSDDAFLSSLLQQGGVSVGVDVWKPLLSLSLSFGPHIVGDGDGS